MQADLSNNSWHGQLTPTSATRAHHRESSLSSLGSAGPSSPYTINSSNPQVVGDLYHDFADYQFNHSKLLTPSTTPSQDHFLTPHYQNFFQKQNAFGISQENMARHSMDADLAQTPDFSHSSRRSIGTVASHDSPHTPPAFEEERPKNAYRSAVPKLDRTMTDIYADELYNPNFQITSTTPASTMSLSTPQNDIFSQTLQAANSQHLSASNTQVSTTMSNRDRSPFRQGSPLAPSMDRFDIPSNYQFGSAEQMRKQIKAENDAEAIQQQAQKSNSDQQSIKTVSPKDVDLVFHESDEDNQTPLFPPSSQQSTAKYRDQSLSSQENTVSQTRQSLQATPQFVRDNSALSNSTQGQQVSFADFGTSPVVSVRQIPQQYPFVPQTRRQTSNLSNADDFPSTLASMESSSSEHNEVYDLKKPTRSLADTGTYTCTYHGCTLRFDTPAKLQRHKREGHRNSTQLTNDPGLTSRNSQAGPHKCDRINPSTGKPCNTIFSRPYDLTRHEDTIHNARKQKVYCPLCTEEKSFSRNDALTRHLRVVHPEHVDASRARRRGGH